MSLLHIAYVKAEPDVGDQCIKLFEVSTRVEPLSNLFARVAVARCGECQPTCMRATIRTVAAQKLFCDSEKLFAYQPAELVTFDPPQFLYSNLQATTTFLRSARDCERESELDEQTSAQGVAFGEMGECALIPLYGMLKCREAAGVIARRSGVGGCPLTIARGQPMRG
jgi:hypothetical protein